MPVDTELQSFVFLLVLVVGGVVASVVYAASAPLGVLRGIVAFLGVRLISSARGGYLLGQI